MSVPMQSSSFENDPFDFVLTTLLPLALVLAYIVPINRIISRVVHERETGMTKTLHLMGLSPFLYYLSFLSYYMVLSTLVSLCLCILLVINVLDHSHFGLLFLFLWLYGLANFGFIALMQSCFDKARTALIVSTIVFFFSSFIDEAVAEQGLEKKYKTLASIIPTVAMKRGLLNIIYFEQGYVGLQPNNLALIYHNYSVSNALYMFVFSFVLGILLGLLVAYLKHLLYFC
mmetsp:Transcript_10165/g.10132  ORF Transcript_10165/g.10132 Transcript_10165/m.10132 type:complete len:230 (+) Transcript_10165:168-857(+)